MLQEVGNLRLHVGSEPEQRLNRLASENAPSKRLRAGKDINLQKPLSKRWGCRRAPPSTWPAAETAKPSQGR